MIGEGCIAYLPKSPILVVCALPPQSLRMPLQALMYSLEASLAGGTPL